MTFATLPPCSFGRGNVRGGTNHPRTKKDQNMNQNSKPSLYAALPKCPQCGELMNGESWVPTDFYVDDDQACCSERCCEKRHLEPMEEAV